jgi:hypothetical protein
MTTLTTEEIDNMVSDIVNDFYNNGMETEANSNLDCVCSVCNTIIKIKNSHSFIGDKIDCAICKLPACNNEICTIECVCCDDRNICSKCSSKCDICKGDVCKRKKCITKLKTCKKCKKQYCENCITHKC